MSRDLPPAVDADIAPLLRKRSVQEALREVARAGGDVTYPGHVLGAGVIEASGTTQSGTFSMVARLVVAGAAAASFFIRNTGANDLEARTKREIEGQSFRDDNIAPFLVLAGQEQPVSVPVDCDAVVLELRHRGAATTFVLAGSVQS